MVSVQIFQNQQLIFEGYMKKIGGGGTKSAYECIGTNKVVLLPNEVDGEALERVFPRICNEECIIHNYLTLNNVACSLLVSICTLKFMDTGKTLTALYAPNFNSFPAEGEYVIDQRNWWNNCCFNRSEREINPTFYNVNSWVPVFEPLITDLKRLEDAGICPAGDSLNFIITSRGSPHHVDVSVPYQVHYFGFGFASKHRPSYYVKAINELEEPDRFLEPVRGYAHGALQTAVDTILAITRPLEAEAEAKEENEERSIVEKFGEFCDKVGVRLGELL
jgi:hypothetical protein